MNRAYKHLLLCKIGDTTENCAMKKKEKSAYE